uniref:hypothetical protein n=1 Tax=Prevotella sp. TaxID=59823 RepID=UPI004027600E
MALIKCNNCGHVMSDRADFCPHCGCPKEFSIKEETSITEETPAKEMTSIKNTGIVSTAEKLYDNDNEATTIQDTDEEDKANKGLVALVIVLAVIAIGFGGYMFFANENQNTDFVTPSDTLTTESIPIDTVMSDTAAKVSTTNDVATADTIIPSNNYNDKEQIEEEEIGFKSNTDIMDFVVGNSYSYNGITLRITDEAVYANDNKISTSKPVFRKISLNKGIITARPSISITVVRDENRLVDNNNGDTYY